VVFRLQRHAKAIGIKFIIVSVVLFSLSGIFHNVTLTKLLFMSVSVTGFTYVLGDVFMYRRFGNIIATLFDFALSFIAVWFLAYTMIEASMSMMLASLGATYLLTMTEPLFHTYMKERVFQVDDELEYSGELQTEFAEEMEDETIKKTKNVSDNKQKDMNDR